MPVRHVIAVLHQKDKKAGTNHWCLYLSTLPTTSVRIDCQPSFTVTSSVLPGGSKVNIIISELSYEVSRDAQAQLQFVLAVAPGLTVGHFYTQPIQAGHHKYEFDSNGVGCRCWTSGQIDMFCQQRFFTHPSQVTAGQGLDPEGLARPRAIGTRPGCLLPITAYTENSWPWREWTCGRSLILSA